jgi:hypothetical protein
MKIEVLYVDDCPSHEALLLHVRRLVAEAQIDVLVEQRRVASDEDAQRQRFLGSPTLRVDGIDVDPGANERRDYGLKCRLYPTADGLRGMPRDEWVLDALHRVTER